MLSASALAGSGSAWVTGVASTSKFPGTGTGTVHMGGYNNIASAGAPTNTEVLASSVYNQTVVLSGLIVVAAAAGTATIFRATTSSSTGGDPATMLTLVTPDTATTGFVSFGPEGLIVPCPAGSVGLTLPASVTASLVYKIV